MSQTRRGSLIEAIANIIIGLWINLIANILILPAYGFSSLTWKTNFILGFWYTLISLARSFLLRRLFNSIKAAWNHHHVK